jgi:outer membrane lipoprotein-sorting protein
MRKALAVGLLGLLVLGTAATANAQTAKTIIDKMIEAQGGRKALGSIKDTTIAGSLEMIQMGMNGSITIYQKEPNKMRMDIEIMGMVITQASDGTQAWSTNPQTGTTEEMLGKQGDDFRRQALGVDASLNPEKYGITYVLKGKEKIGEKEYFVLEQSFKDGATATMHVDAGTYLTYKVKAKSTDMTGAEVETETITEDYRKVGETMVAHKMTIFQNGAEFIRMTFTSAVYNSGIEDALFKMTK